MSAGAKGKRQAPFLSFEGGEGSGKSTQAAMLHATLIGQGRAALLTREPGGTPAGNVVREILLGGHAAAMGPLAEACLLTSARRDHVEKVIAPTLSAGTMVICDRYADSTRVYQGFVGGLDSQTIASLEAVAVNGIYPDITFVLDVSPETANQRRLQRLAVKGDGDDRFERENSDFHARVAEGFRRLCQQETERCVLIDSGGNKETIAATILQALRARAIL